jgi:hypothetical protein
MSSHLRAWLLKRSIVCLPVCNRRPLQLGKLSAPRYRRCSAGWLIALDAPPSAILDGRCRRRTWSSSTERMTPSTGAISMLCSPSVTPTWSSSLTQCRWKGVTPIAATTGVRSWSERVLAGYAGPRHRDRGGTRPSGRDDRAGAHARPWPRERGADGPDALARCARPPRKGHLVAVCRQRGRRPRSRRPGGVGDVAGERRDRPPRLRGFQQP